MTAVLKTENSALILHDIDIETAKLIEKCVQVCDSELIVNPEIKIFGKTYHQHRSIGFYSNTSQGYYYSGQLAVSKKLHTCMVELLNYINKKFSYDYNGILVNKYLNGEDYIGKHSDDESGLEQRVGVVSMSYGAIRKFRIRNKETNKIEIDVPTEPNKIIQMYGNFQKEFTHEIPVEKKVKEVRYSFTFRKHMK